MIDRAGVVHRSVAGLAVLPLAFTGVVLMAPAASASQETTSKTCDTSKNGHGLDVKVKVWHNDDGDVEKVTVRATDRGETGKFDERHVNLKSIVVKYVDDDGNVDVDEDDSDSPFVLGDDGTDIEDVKVTVTWKVHGDFKTKTCNIYDLDD